MLVRFVVNNFLSFGKECEFNMLASSLKTHKHHVYKAGKLDVLKSAAIYGANGAGKSNLIIAIEFLQKAVLSGEIDKSINDKKFKLDKSCAENPVSFEIEFSIHNKIYAYGLSFEQHSVVEEWLYESGITKEDKLIFERKKINNSHHISVAEKYQKTQKQKFLIELMEESLLKDRELFLGKSIELRIDEISSVREYLSNYLVIIHPSSKYQGLIPHLTQSSSFKKFANGLLKTFDTGVSELDVESVDFEKFFGEEDEARQHQIKEDIEEDGSVLFNSHGNSVFVTKENEKYIVKKVVSTHLDIEGEKVNFDLSLESEGTQRLLDFIPAFDGILKSDVTFIIDEIDQSLHPTLLKSLVQKIMSDQTTMGQLIFTTHESNLLDLEIFRQDEIWFAEKEKKSGRTQLYSLSEFKPRYDLDIRKGYLKGRFGAIPFLANLEELNWNI